MTVDDMCSQHLYFKWIPSVLFTSLLCFISISSQALEFSADSIQIAGYDPASRYLGFVLLDESGGGNEIWWVIEPASGKALHCYDLRRLSLAEGGMQAVYRAQAQQCFDELKLHSGSDARTSVNQDELELPNGRLRIVEAKGGFAFALVYLKNNGQQVSLYNEDLTEMRQELGQPPGYYFAGGKISPNGRSVAILLDYDNGDQSNLPFSKLLIIDLKTLENN
jgi:hypothetical protein